MRRIWQGWLWQRCCEGSGSQHKEFGCLKQGMLCAHLLGAGNCSGVGSPHSLGHFLFCKINSSNSEGSGCRCRLGFSDLTKTTKTSFGCKTWSKDWGSIAQILFEGRGWCQSMWLALSLLLHMFSEFGSIYQVCGEHNFEFFFKMYFLPLLGISVWEWHLQCPGSCVCDSGADWGYKLKITVCCRVLCSPEALARWIMSTALTFLWEAENLLGPSQWSIWGVFCSLRLDWWRSLGGAEWPITLMYFFLGGVGSCPIPHRAVAGTSRARV